MSMVEPLSPWAEGADENEPLDPQLGRLFRALPEPGPLPDLARQRVALRLRKRASRGAGLMLVRLIAIGVVIGVAGAAAAQWAVSHFMGTQRELFTPRLRAVVQNPPLAPQPSLPREPAAAAPEAPALEERVSAAQVPVPAASSSQLGLEAASLQKALTALRAGGAASAARALDGIEQHLRAFPRGALELEARVVRVDALLTLGRRQDAKKELLSLPIESVGRNRELRLIRAELRADDDCRAALADFQVLVDQALPPAWAERALFGRGACRLKLGDSAGAERDFQSYLQRFPNGRFAAQIRAQKP